jgi:diguanylate cyclase (GGDEF)-like protein
MELAEFAGVFDYLRESGRKLVEEKRKLKGLGLIDHLSQLPNRRYFEKRLKEAHETCRTHGPSSVLIIDVDHFKQVNDQHGHDIGDALIVAFAKALRESVRQTDFLARLGGDEFCVVYRYVPLNKASAFVERLRKQLPREVELPKGIRHPLKWTGGLAAIADGDQKFDDVLWRADKALLEAKTAGRNNTKVYQPESSKPRLRLMM